MHDLRTGLFDRLQRQSVGFFTKARGGEVQSRLTNDINGVQNVVTSTATSIASNVTVVVGTAVAMAALSWRLSLLSLLVLPPAIWLTRRVARLRHKITAERQRRLADLNVQIEETLSVSGALLTRTLGAASRMSDRFTATSRDLVDLQIRSMLAGPLADGHDDRGVRRDPGRDLPRRRPARDLRRHDHRHPGRLHRPAGHALPPADVAAQRRRRRDRLAGPLQPDLRVPGPADRDRRPRHTRRPRRGPRRRDARGRLVRLRRRVARACSTASTCTCRPAPRSPSSARPAAARPPSPGWSPGSTTRRPDGCCSTASTCATYACRPRRRGRRRQPGHLPAARFRARQPAARPAGRDRRRDRAGLPGRPGSTT